MNIFSLPQTEEAAIQFLQSKNILPTNKTCPNGHEMKLNFFDWIYKKIAEIWPPK